LSAPRASERPHDYAVTWRTGDGAAYFHCPADTRHVIVGAGDGPCAILMVGARSAKPIRYPESEVAAKYGASAAKETGDQDEAYADWPASPSRRGYRGRSIRHDARRDVRRSFVDHTPDGRDSLPPR
jgi:hypothetical protein